MATYFIQVRSVDQGKRWQTVAKTDNEALAEFVSLGLYQKMQVEPGESTGRRQEARFISKSRLHSEEGLSSLATAEYDLVVGWDKTASMVTEVETLEQNYWKKETYKNKNGEDEFLMRCLPGDLREELASRAKAEGVTNYDLLIRLVSEGLKRGAASK